jgi:transposase
MKRRCPLRGSLRAWELADGRREQREVLREIQAHTREGSLHYTDEWQACATLRTRGTHVMIRE